jgi:4-hydroxybenzoate polyprenyltransferase
MGIILVNTSEDLFEDRAAGVRTTTVALGLPGTTRLAATLVAVGGAGFCGFWLVDFGLRGVPPVGYVALLALAGMCVFVLGRLVRLDRMVRRSSDERVALRVVKAQGRLVPVGATLVGWFGLGCAVVSVALGSG